MIHFLQRGLVRHGVKPALGHSPLVSTSPVGPEDEFLFGHGLFYLHKRLQKGNSILDLSHSSWVFFPLNFANTNSIK